MTLLARAAYGWTDAAWPATNVYALTVVSSNESGLVLAGDAWLMDCWSGMVERSWAAVNEDVLEAAGESYTNYLPLQPLRAMEALKPALAGLVGSYVNTNAYGTNWPPSTWPSNGWEMLTTTGIVVDCGLPSDWWRSVSSVTTTFWEGVYYYTTNHGYVSDWRMTPTEYQECRAVLAKLTHTAPENSSISRDWSYNVYRISEAAMPTPSIDPDSFCDVVIDQGVGGWSLYPTPSWGQGEAVSESETIEDYHFYDPTINDFSYMSGGAAWMMSGAQQNCLVQSGVKDFAYARVKNTNAMAFVYMAYVGPYISDASCRTSLVVDTAMEYKGKKSIDGEMSVDGYTVLHSALMDGPSAIALNRSPNLVTVHMPDDINQGGCGQSTDTGWTPYYTVDAYISREHAYILEWNFNYK